MFGARTQSDEVVDGCNKYRKRIPHLSVARRQQAADVGILGTFTFASIIPSCSFTFASIIHLVPLLLQASSLHFLVFY